MIAYSIMGIALLWALTIYASYRETKERKIRFTVVIISSCTAILAVVLLFKPELPGPTQLLQLLFGWVSG